jgi:hypothetical protein
MAGLRPTQAFAGVTLEFTTINPANGSHGSITSAIPSRSVSERPKVDLVIPAIAPKTGDSGYSIWV